MGAGFSYRTLTTEWKYAVASAAPRRLLQLNIRDVKFHLPAYFPFSANMRIRVTINPMTNVPKNWGTVPWK